MAVVDMYDLSLAIDIQYGQDGKLVKTGWDYTRCPVCDVVL